MKITDVKIYRGQVLQFSEWITWNGSSASSWGWEPMRDLRERMPWLPISIPAKTLDQMKEKVDSYLDNIDKHREYYNTQINATAEWCAKYGSE